MFFVTEQRHLADTKMKLDDNSTVQRQLNEAASYAEMDLRNKQMQQNIEVNLKYIKNISSLMPMPNKVVI